MRSIIAAGAVIVTVAGAAFIASSPAQADDPPLADDRPLARDPLNKPAPAPGMCWNPAYREVAEFVGEPIHRLEITGSPGNYYYRNAPTGRYTVHPVSIHHVVPYAKCGDPGNYNIPAHNPPEPWITIPVVIVVAPDGTPLYDKN